MVAWRTARGFTLLELVVVLAILGIALSVVVPRFRLSPSLRVAADARQVIRDLELARTRALVTKRRAELVFDVAGKSYTGYLDDDGNGTFLESATEMQALRSRGKVSLSPDVSFGRGGATALPGDSTATGAVTFLNHRVTFGANGVTTPFGSRGTIYFVSDKEPEIVAAVSVSGAGSFKLWRYNKEAGAWQ